MASSEWGWAGGHSLGLGLDTLLPEAGEQQRRAKAPPTHDAQAGDGTRRCTVMHGPTQHWALWGAVSRGLLPPILYPRLPPFLLSLVWSPLMLQKCPRTPGPDLKVSLHR